MTLITTQRNKENKQFKQGEAADKGSTYPLLHNYIPQHTKGGNTHTQTKCHDLFNSPIQ